MRGKRVDFFFLLNKTKISEEIIRIGLSVANREIQSFIFIKKISVGF